MTPKRWANIPILPRSCGVNRIAAQASASLPCLAAILAVLSLVLVTGVPGLPAQSRAATKKPAQGQVPAKTPAPERRTEAEPEKQVAELARALREEESSAAYARLSSFAKRRSASELGARAALALGYYDYTKGRYAKAQQWLEKAQRDTLLREYVLYWRAQVARGLGRQAEALSQLETFRREFPASVMTEQAVQSFVEVALVLGQPGRALAVLEGYDKASARPALLLLRAQAREKSARDREASVAALRDYRDVYYRFPLSEEAAAAGTRVASLARSLGGEFPGVSPEEQVALRMNRAAAFYDARKWSDARAEYERLLPLLRKTAPASELERAELRIAQSRIKRGAGPVVLASLALTDPELNGERLYLLAQARRSQKQETEMLAVIEQLAARYPQSPWAEEGLFSAGNYFWVNLDRKRAASYYQRELAQFPAGKNAPTAHWRLAWLAYLDRRAEAAALFEEHLRRFPGSAYTVDALYWLGRAAEHEGSVAHARSFYLKAQDRFPQTYFSRQASERLRLVGPAPVNSADFLALIPSPPPLPPLEEAIPPPAAERWRRAQALRAIAFDASAELELRAAYAATSSSRLLWEAARAASEAGRYAAGISTARQVYPQIESRKLEEVPLEVWRTVYPLPYEATLKRAAAREKVDPMLVAGLIRQESVFQPDAVSRAGAVGLMQVLPRTGQKLARRLKLRYARARLFNPEYNLRLGTLYLADLVKTQGNPEKTLAAFNAGEERVAAWEAKRRYDEPAEFVESIPFTETREYVQIVLRNAEIYRRLYEKPARGAP